MSYEAKYMKTLPSREGYPVDLRKAGTDRIAEAFTRKHFGDKVVDDVTGKFHRATLTSAEMNDDFMKFDRRHVPMIKQDPVYFSILQTLREELVPEKKIIPFTTGGAWAAPEFPKDKSPGLPYRELGYKTKGEVLDHKSNRNEIMATWYAVGAGNVHHLPDTMIFYRAQICKTDANKIRAVFGYPLTVFSEEVRWVYPLMRYLKTCTNDFPIAYGLEMANGGMQYVNEMCNRSPPGSTFVINDYRMFDKTVPPWLIRDAFSILADCFDMGRVESSDGLIWEVDAEKSLLRFKRMMRYFINTPVRLNSGERFMKQGGIPSGSGWTNIVGSILNAIITRYAVYNTTGSLPFADIYMGDDSFVVVEGPVNLEDLATVVEENFGVILNTDKSWVTTSSVNVHFLGYYNLDGVAFKPQDTIIASFIYPERKPDDVQTTCARGLGQLWSSLGSRSAQKWLELVQDIMETYSISSQWIEDYLHRYPNRFRFLKTLGLNPVELGLPEPSLMGVVTIVEPSPIALRQFKSRYRNLKYLYSRYNEEDRKSVV